jgi:hypothetical protein
MPLVPVIVRHRERFEAGFRGVDHGVIPVASASLAKQQRREGKPRPNIESVLTGQHGIR